MWTQLGEMRREVEVTRSWRQQQAIIMLAWKDKGEIKKRQGERNGSFVNPVRPWAIRKGTADRSCCLGRKQSLPENKKIQHRVERNLELSLPLHANLLPVPSTWQNPREQGVQVLQSMELSFPGHRPNKGREWIRVGNTGEAPRPSDTNHLVAKRYHLGYFSV